MGYCAMQNVASGQRNSLEVVAPYYTLDTQSESNELICGMPKIRIQKGLTRLDSGSKSNRMAFNKDKCKSNAIRPKHQVARRPGGEMGVINHTPEQRPSPHHCLFDN